MQTQINVGARKHATGKVAATKKSAAKKPAAHHRNGVRRSASDRKFDEIFRLASKLKGSFGPT